MRDPKRIIKTLALIKLIWDKAPDLRLCQLLGNCFGQRDLYHIEDDQLQEALINTYGEIIIREHSNKVSRKITKTKNKTKR